MIIHYITGLVAGGCIGWYGYDMVFIEKNKWKNLLRVIFWLGVAVVNIYTERH